MAKKDQEQSKYQKVSHIKIDARLLKQNVENGMVLMHNITQN